MAIEFKQSFVVKAAPDAVWAFLTDPRRAASALAGAAVTEQVDDTTFLGTITVKVGPVTTQYRGKARFERLDAATRTAEVVASGQDVKGKGGADMKMTSRLVERAPGETEVSVASEVSVTGILAQLGRGMIQDVSEQMFQRFTAAVRAELEAPAPSAAGAASAVPGAGAAGPSAAPPASATPPTPASAAPLDAVSFGTELAGRVARRWARQPAFWLAVLALGYLVYRLLLR
jgi:hypothetical protein